MSNAQQARMGFGTGLPALQSAPDAARLIEGALDSGIRHIDTAPLYLWGAAESLVGQVATRRRNDMFIVSKTGLQPPSAGARVAAKLGRVLSRSAQHAEPRSGLFAPAQVIASVEKSLRALQTDRLDALLLHEVRPHDMSDALIETLRKIKDQGKALAIGLATDGESTHAIARAYPGFFDIFQTAWGDSSIASARPCIFHSVLQRRGAAIARRAANDGDFARRIAETADVDPLDSDALGSLLMRAAMTETRGGVVLFSSANPTRIAANARLTPLDPNLLQKLRLIWSNIS
jgi:aryl-alcohol dehydrogenase-like predicted oxidoreductase